MAKAAFILIAQAILIQTALSCGCGSGFGSGFGSIGSGISSSGGNFPTASSSPYPPIGISVQSENYYEGELCVNGNLPFLGTVALEGVVPTQGSGSVCYSCGNDNVAITEESSAGRGCGCGCGRL